MDLSIDPPEQSGSRRQSLLFLGEPITRDDLHLNPPRPLASEGASTSQVDDLGNGKHLEQQNSEQSDAEIPQQTQKDELVAETGTGLETGEDGDSISEELNALIEPRTSASSHTDNPVGPDRHIAQDPPPAMDLSSMEGDIREAICYTASKDPREFLPVDALDRIVTKDRVRQEIDRHENEFPTNLDAAVSQIWDTSSFSGQKTSRKKLFAILVLIDKLEAIWDFIREDIYDFHLPFEKLESPPQSKRGKGPSLTELSRRTDTSGQERAIIAFESWKDHEIRNFEYRQWEVCVPIFFLNSEERTTIPHYKLQNKIILPFIEDDETKHNGTMGGYSEVWRVRIHPSHHNPGTLAANKNEPPSFAIKRLRVSNEDAFWGEVQNLKRFSKRDHLHLIKLLGTYHWRDQYYFIFPWADGNLLDFWKSHPLPIAGRGDRRDAIWFSKQCLGLVEGVKMIHNWEKPVASGDRYSFRADQTHGLHGDLKPENILWFKQDGGSGEGDSTWGHFKISDFGLSHFHKTNSVANIDAANTGLTPTYRGPERDVKRKVSQSYDIWSLACVLLEFVSWYLGGWPEVQSFTERRVKEDIPYDSECKIDRFFNSTTEEVLEGGQGRVKLCAVGKRSVIEEFGKLYNHPDCSDFITDLLRLVETNLLRLDPQNRIDCDAIAQRLHELDSDLQADPDYGIMRLKKLPARSSTLDSVLINGDFAPEVKNSVLQKYRSDTVRDPDGNTITSPADMVLPPDMSTGSLATAMAARPRSPSPSTKRGKVRLSQCLESVQELPDTQLTSEIGQRTVHWGPIAEKDSGPGTSARNSTTIEITDNPEPEGDQMAQNINESHHSALPMVTDVQSAVHSKGSQADRSSNDATSSESMSFDHPSRTRPSESHPEMEEQCSRPQSIVIAGTDQSRGALETEAKRVPHHLNVPRDEQDASSIGTSNTSYPGKSKTISNRDDYDVDGSRDVSRTRNGTQSMEEKQKPRSIFKQRGARLKDRESGSWRWLILSKLPCFT